MRKLCDINSSNPKINSHDPRTTLLFIMVIRTRFIFSSIYVFVLRVRNQVRGDLNLNNVSHGRITRYYSYSSDFSRANHKNNIALVLIEFITSVDLHKLLRLNN